MEQHEDSSMRLGRYLSPLSAWAMSFGCAVGWGAFVMPATEFLPLAGPVGTLIGLAAGAAVMFLVGRNYHYLIQHFPESGGAYGYVKRICGVDHGYICGWFLLLTYMAIVWANATALALIGRNLLGGLFSFGFRYEVAGFDIYAGEILLSVGVLLAVLGVFLVGKRLTARLQAIFALLLCAGIAVCMAAVLSKHEGGLATFAPAFADGRPTALQIFGIVALAPWAFVGFESVSHSAEEFSFPRWRTVWIIMLSLAAATLAYVSLTFIAISTLPPGFANWREYMASLGTLQGLEAMPAFYAVKSAMGTAGLAILCFTALAAILTGIVGHTVAASRLLYSMAHDGLLPARLAELDRDKSPRNAILFVIVLSCLLPFVGRTAVGWIVDVTTIGASIAYGYVSFCAFKVAKEEGRRFVMASGCAGLVVSVAFLMYFLIPNFWGTEVLATESYLIMVVWSVIGIGIFRAIFNGDSSGRLGSSTVGWLALLFFVFFAGHMWDRQMTHAMTDRTATEIHEHLAETMADPDHSMDDCNFLEKQRDGVDDSLTMYNLVQISLMVLVLAVMYSIYATMARRERHAAKAKAYFFSTISHDVRTPLNAIVGFSQMLKLGFKTKKETDDAVDSILASSKALLGLINDILDLSRCNVDKAEVAHTPTDCHALMHEIVESFRVASADAKVKIQDKIEDMPELLIDHMRLRHVVFNLMANAVKFTEKGFIELRSKFDVFEKDSPTGTLRIEVEDTGVGISAEDQKHIDSPYEQTDSKISRNGGTGFGLAVGRQFVEAMGGKLTVKSATGKGSTFFIDIPGVHVAPKHSAHELSEVHHAEEGKITIPRALLVDDSKMNLTVLKALMKRLGTYELETAMNGKAALERLKRTDLPPFDVILTDMWMPEMDGAELAMAIRADERLAKLPVYVITADVELEDNYSEKGFDDIVLKPVTIDSLTELLMEREKKEGGGE